MVGQGSGGNHDPFLDACGIAGISDRCLEVRFLELFCFSIVRSGCISFLRSSVLQAEVETFKVKFTLTRMLFLTWNFG